MSKLSFLQGKSKKYIVGTVELELKPLSLGDMDLFTIDQNTSAKEQAENSIKLIDKVLTDSVPDSTPDERKNIGIQHMEELMNAIMDVNGLKDTKSGLDAIKTRQAEIKAKRQGK